MAVISFKWNQTLNENQDKGDSVDDQIRKMYALDEPEAKEPDSPSDEGTESNEQTPPQDLEESTLASVEKPQEVEATVAESRYKEAVSAMNRAQSELADRRKQDSEKDSYIQQLQDQNHQLLQLQENNKKTEASTQSSTEDDTDLAEAKEIYPEVINPLLKMIAKLEKKLAAVSDDVGNVKSDVGNVRTVADRYQQSEQKTEADKHFDAIKAKHPDLDSIVTDPTYADWYHNQGPLIQQALQKGTTKDAIAALNLFRAEYPKEPVLEAKKDTKPEVVKTDKLAAAKEAAAPTIKAGQNKPEQKTVWTREKIGSLSRDEFRKHQDEINLAMANREVL